MNFEEKNRDFVSSHPNSDTLLAMTLYSPLISGPLEGRVRTLPRTEGD